MTGQRLGVAGPIGHAVPTRGSESRPTRVGVIDDHNLVREGLKLVLSGQPDIVVVGEAASAAEARGILAVRPDVVLLDLSLGDDDGIPLLRWLVGQAPTLKVIVLSMHRDAETVRQALNAGAAGYVPKGARGHDLLDSVRAVRSGERYLHSSVTAAVVDDSMRWSRSGMALSAREREVVALTASGKTAAQVGAALGISPHTVRRHIANVSAKVDVHGPAAMARYAAQHGLVRDLD